MKKTAKILTFLLIISILASLFAFNTAAAVSGKAGQTVKVTFSFPNAYGANGHITYSNSGILSDVSVSSNLAGTCTKDAFLVFGTAKTTVTVTVTAKIKSSAKAGDSCTISIADAEYSDVNGDVHPAPKSDVITVAATQSGGNQGGNNNKPSSKIDYTELNRQIKIASSLEKTGYTDASWKNMTDALAAARKLTSSNSQSAVDAGAKRLADAIAALEKVDYTKLREALDQVQSFIDGSDFASTWAALMGAVDNGNSMLKSGNQADIDSAAEALITCLDAMKAKLNEMTKTVEVPVEKPIEVEPSGPYCNIAWHLVLIILFFVSLAVNIVFVVLTVLWFMKKKKNTKDTTPLVDYKIGDDD